MKPEKRSVVAELPPVIREQFFSVFAEPEPEMIHPDLYREIIDVGTDLILDRMKEYCRKRRRIVERVRDAVTVKQAKRDEGLSSANVLVSSDAGNNGVDTRSAFMPLYASVAVAARGWKIIDEPISLAGKPEIWGSEDRSRERESMLAMKAQFDVTYKAVEKWSPRFVVFDGPLLLHYGLVPGKGSSGEYWQNFKDAASSAVRLLHECYRRRTVVVGFVKRTRMAELGKELGTALSAGMKIRDTALLDLVLRLGQYTLLDTVITKGGVVKRYRISAKEFGLSRSETGAMTRFHSAYIRTGLTTPFRLEFPEYCLGSLDEVASILYTTSEEDGLPFALHEADKLTKMTTTISNIRTLMLFSKALDLVESGELSPEDMNLFALQHGEAWTLRDEKYFQDVREIQGGG